MTPGDFDPPHAGKARIYPIPGGMLESAGIGDGILDPRLIVVSGKDETVETLAGLPALRTTVARCWSRRSCARAATRARAWRARSPASYAAGGWRSSPPTAFAGKRQAICRLSRQSGARPTRFATAGPVTASEHCVSPGFEPSDQRSEGPTEEEIREILGHTNKFFPEDELNCGACGYPTCRAKAAAVYEGMAEEAMCLPFIIDQAERVCHELNVPWSNLRDVHRHLINSEKLASMGQMAAGVAHELNNPLSTILLYSHILQRKLKDRDDLDHDLKLMAEESERCKKIIGNLLDFARQSRVRIESVSVEELVASAADGAACNLPPGPDNGVEIVVDVTPGLRADLDRDQMTQVLVNLIKNGVEAMEGRSGTVRVRPARCRMPTGCASASPTKGAASPPGRRTRSSSRSSPPRASARAPASVCPSPTASSRCTTATSGSNRSLTGAPRST